MSDTLVAPFGAAVAPVDLSAGEIAASFHESSRQSALAAFKSSRDEIFEREELETRLWDLVARLTSSPNAALNEQHSEVIKWLQSNLPQVPLPEDLQSIKWMYTKHRATKGGPNAVVSELDLDAPLRQALPIAEEDRKADETLYKYVFELLLTGDLARAQSVCAETNNWLLRAALAAAPDSAELVLDACKQLSAESRLNKWESAVYGLLSHNLPLIAPLCNSWEKLLLVHLQANASLADFERAVSHNSSIAKQHEHWCRRIVLAIIQQRVPELITKLVSEVSTVEEPTLVAEPYLCRVLLHLQLVLNLAAHNEYSVNSTLAQIYIEYLCDTETDLSERLALVPEYARLLPPDNQPSVYGYVLAQITDETTQATQLKQAKSYNINIAPALEHAISLNFELASSVFVESELTPPTPTDNSDLLSPIEASNHRLVGVLRWLILAELWPTAASALLRAYILFLTQNRRSGAVLLSQTISSDFVHSRALEYSHTQLQNFPDLVAELTQLRQCTQLAEALGALDVWHSVDRSVAHWRLAATKAMDTAVEAVTRALSFGTHHLASENSATVDEIALIRQRYIPLIVYELLSMLTAPDTVTSHYVDVALQFAVKIADEENRLYELFDASLLNVLAKPALML